jgi:xylulokinase
MQDKKMALLGVDLGTSNCKAAVFGNDGEIISKKVKPYNKNLKGGTTRSEMPPASFLETFIEVIRSFESEIRQKIDAFSISSQGETYIALDSRGIPIGNFILNSDTRANEETLLLEKILGREYLYEICGVPPHNTFSLTKIFWHKRRGLYKNAYCFLSVADYILQQLGMGYYTDYSLASRVMGFDIKEKKWSAEILDVLNLSDKQFPVPLPAGVVLGKLKMDVALLLGLKQGIAVCLGGHDQPCGALGMGVLDENEAMVSAGTYECMAVSSRSPRNTREALQWHINSYCHVIDGKYITLAFFPGAMVVDWVIDLFCQPEVAQNNTNNILPNKILDNMIKDIPGPTGICFTPHLIGALNPDWDTRATTVIAGLRPETTRLHLYKAVYEGIAFELAHNVAVMEKLAGKIDVLRISGGGARLDIAVSLRAAFTGKPIVKMQSSESVCLGAAMIAGIGIGVFKDYIDASRNMVHIIETVTPDLEIQKDYENQRKQYDLLFPSLEAYRKLQT